MGPTVISGLPAHILLVHVVLAIVPVAAVLVIVAGIWPGARRWLNWLPPLAALGALVAVPITTHAGHWLEDHLRGQVTPAIRHHVDLGAASVQALHLDGLVPGVVHGRTAEGQPQISDYGLAHRFAHLRDERGGKGDAAFGRRARGRLWRAVVDGGLGKGQGCGAHDGLRS